MPGERRTRLEKVARPLTPQRGPYYRWTPRAPAEPAPGWYMVPRGLDSPVYLGAHAVDAELTLRQMLEQRAEAVAS